MASVNYKRIEKQIVEAIAAIRSGTGGMYDVATWSISLFNASDDYAAAVGIAGDDVIDRLNGYLRDFAVDLANLIAIMKYFPAREQWDRPLMDLLAAANEKIASGRKADSEHSTQRTAVRVTRKEYDAVVKRAEDAEFKVNRTVSEIDQLRAENADLRRENMLLKGRIDQLERMTNAGVRWTDLRVSGTAVASISLSE